MGSGGLSFSIRPISNNYSPISFSNVARKIIGIYELRIGVDSSDSSARYPFNVLISILGYKRF